MPRATPAFCSLVALLIIPLCASNTLASAIVQGAYYRLGDADPAAASGAIGDDPTVDSLTLHADLRRFGSPRYASDVPARRPADHVLPTQFANVARAGPAF